MAQGTRPMGGLTASDLRSGRWEWGVCWLMFASTVLNYMDRQAVALVNPQIRAEFHIDQEGFGWVLAAFYLTYAVFQVPAGYLTDRWDVRRTYAGAVAWWSAAGIAAAVSPTLGVLMAFRALLGVGESFNWPCALRVTATILPPADRSLGNGIFNSGAAIGAVLTPLIVPFLAKVFGWRAAFVGLGSLGLLWLTAWLVLLRGDRAARAFAVGESAPELPGESQGIGLSSAAGWAFGAVTILAVLIGAIGFASIGLPAIWWGIAVFMVGPLLVARALPIEALRGADWARSLGEVVRHRRFWVLVIVSVTVNVCWHFLVNWMATFFQVERAWGALAGGMVSAVPFLAADAGNLGGGALSRELARRGRSRTSARMLVVAVGALLVAGGVMVGGLRDDRAILVVVSLMALGAASYMANYFAFCQEVAPRHTGLIVGILGGLGNLFAAGFMPIAGRIKDTTGGFGPVFVVVGLLPLIGLAALVLGWGPEEAEPDLGSA